MKKSHTNIMRAERDRLGWTQEQLAQSLECGTRTVTALEAMDEKEAEKSRRFQKYWRRLQLATTPHSNEFPGSEKYGYRQEEFDFLAERRVVANQASRVDVEADFFPLLDGASGGQVRYAKAYMKVTYHNLSTDDESDGFVIDAVGNPQGSLYLRLVTPSSSVEKIPDHDVFDSYDDLLKKPQASFLPFGGLQFRKLDASDKHVVCYQIRGVDGVTHPKIEILYFANQATLIGNDSMDAIGFALPADLLIGSVAIRVRFHAGLQPVEEDSPSGRQRTFSRPFLIRRYARVAVPDKLYSPYVPQPVRHRDSETYDYRLARPKPGYGHVISWKGLELRGVAGDQSHCNLVHLAEESRGRDQKGAVGDTRGRIRRS